MNMKINNEHEYRRALIFQERKTMVHVSRINGIFTNGLLIEVSKEFFIIKDRFSGKEITIFYSELKKPLVVWHE